jgi:hypothetical protein
VHGFLLGAVEYEVSAWLQGLSAQIL